MELRIFTKVIEIITIFVLSATTLALAAPPDTASESDLISQGQQNYNHGHYVSALEAWDKVLDKYRLTNNTLGQAQVLQYKAQAYLEIGQYYKATNNLRSALQLANDSGDSQLAAQITSSLGTALMLSNNIDEARTLLEKAITGERAAGHFESAAIAGINYGNLLASQKQYESAISTYQTAISDAKASNNSKLAINGLVNASRAMIDFGHTNDALKLLAKASSETESLSPSHEKAYDQISISLLYSRLASMPGASSKDLKNRAYMMLTKAESTAEGIKDKRAMSYAYGYMGTLEEQAGHSDKAMRYTNQALDALNTISAPEISYRWQWQEGRLLRSAGHSDQALSAYKRAVDDIQKIRPMLASTNIGKSDHFRKESGQVYLELADLLLKKSGSEADPKNVQADLVEARNTVEMLKGAELENYFQDDCVAELKAKTTGIDHLGAHTAALYPIILPNRLEILLSLPDGIKRYTVQVSADELNKEINSFRSLLEKRITNQYRRPASKLYQWLIKPLEKDLQADGITTIVYIPDGEMRTVPLAALYDGKDFLISRYAIATSPGLTLTDPKPLPRTNMHLLVAGLTKSVQGFPALPDVAGEVDSLKKLYKKSDVIENDTFTQTNFKDQLQDTPFSIVHIASHGSFQSDVQNTFLLTYNGKLKMDTLAKYMASTTYRDQPVELLTLSACQTAVGDDRAALGLGGVAVKAGARSALATLWYINDQASSELIADFYSNLQNPDISKAQALRQAQLTMTKDPRFSHPSYWAPFLLIGNWL